MNNLGNQVTILKKDSDTIKKNQNTHDQQINNLENKTDELEDAHQSMKQEIKYGSPISSETRQKIMGSSKLSPAIKYTKPPFCNSNDNSKPEPETLEPGAKM